MTARMIELTSDTFESELPGTSLYQLKKMSNINKKAGHDISVFVRSIKQDPLPPVCNDIKREPNIEPGESLCKREPDYLDYRCRNGTEKSTSADNTSSHLGILQQTLLSTGKQLEPTLNESCGSKYLKLEPGECIYQPVKVEPEEIILSDDDDDQSVILIDDEENSGNLDYAEENVPLTSTDFKSSLTNSTSVQEINHDHHMSREISASSQENNQEEVSEIIFEKNNKTVPSSGESATSNDNIIKLGVSDLERIAKKLCSAEKVTQRVIQERFRSICSSRPTPYARGTTTPILNPKETNKTNNRGHSNAVLPKPQPASERINKGNLPESSSSQSKPINITITTAPLKNQTSNCGLSNVILPKPQLASPRINKGNHPESSSSQSELNNSTTTTAPLKYQTSNFGLSNVIVPKPQPASPRINKGNLPDNSSSQSEPNNSTTTAPLKDQIDNCGHSNVVLPKPQPASPRINKGNLPESSSSQSEPNNSTTTTAPLKKTNNARHSNLFITKAVYGYYGQVIEKSKTVQISGIPFTMEVKENLVRDSPNAQPFYKKCKICGDNVFLDLNHFVDHLRHHGFSHMYCFVCQRGVCSPFYAERHAEIHHKNYVECNECFRFFPDAKTLKTHKITHKGKAPFRCEHCPTKSFMTLKQVKEHIKMCPNINFTPRTNFPVETQSENQPCTSGGVCQCPKCSKSFKTKTELIKHLESHSDYVRTNYPCKICDNVFDSYNKLIIHCRNHVLENDCGITDFTCQMCKKKLKNVESLRAHVRRHTKKRYHCSVCQIGFTRQKHVIRHLEIHAKNYLRCHQCFLFYKDKVELKCHERQHRMGPPFYCEHCPKEKFESFAPLNRHIQNCHINLKCGKCNKKFDDLFKLTLHEYTHVKKFLCKHCGKKFARQDYLKKHMTIHKKSRAYKCPVCKHKFSRSDNFKVHIRKMHKSDKTYECPCGRKFEQKFLLRMHEAYHRWYILECDFCNGKFKKYSEIKKHIMIEHLKFTKYTCDVCKEDFLKHENLISHYDKKHENMNSICDVCGLEFSSYSKLKDHQDTHEIEKSGVKTPAKKEGKRKKIRKPVFSSYKCDYCKTIFNAMRTLKHHILTEHLDAENYECELCGGGFLSFKSLNNHYYKNHRDENAVCDVCGSHFAKYGDFIKHKNQHQKDRVLECDKCKKTFLTNAQLKRHRLNTHQRIL